MYDEEQRAAVMQTVLDGYPLNVMYWAANEDGTYEVMDGQQRTISLCQYVDGEYAIDIDGHPRYFHNLPQVTQDKIRGYELMVYTCEGDDEERLAWPSPTCWRNAADSYVLRHPETQKPTKG